MPQVAVVDGGSELDLNGGQAGPRLDNEIDLVATSRTSGRLADADNAC